MKNEIGTIITFAIITVAVIILVVVLPEAGISLGQFGGGR